jgi:hypothetical protein
MTTTLQLTEQKNPTAQTFVVDEASVLTGIGIFFASTSSTYPITLELRPTTEGGIPSVKEMIPGSRVTAGPGTGNTISGATTSATTFYSSPPEHKFTFEEPVYVPANTLVSFVLYTSAPTNDYKIYTAETLKFKFGKTNSFHTSSSTTERGAYFASTNGTAWEANVNKDITFKVYRAHTTATAVLNANNPGYKNLSETSTLDGLARYSFDPLRFTAGSSTVSVNHPGHGFQSGDKVTLISDGVNSFDSGDTINGITGSDILGERTITAVDPFGYSFTMGDTADSSIRGGGTGLSATENNVINQMYLNIPYLTPPRKSFAGSETAYNTSSNIKVHPNQLMRLNEPHLIASEGNETLRLSGNPSSKFTVSMVTDNPNVAPYFNVTESHLTTEEYLIDYQDSDNTLYSNRNTISTIDFVAETSADGGTSASKHITVPYILETSSTSITAILDAIRPIDADFSLWYRVTNSSNENSDLEDKAWIEFDKNAKNTNGKTYNEISANDLEFKEYQFEVFGLDAFDQYQLKITMNSRRSSFPPVVNNLRIIATV